MTPDVAFGSIVRCRGLTTDRAPERRSWIVRDSGGDPGAEYVGADVANPFPLLGQALQRVSAGSPIRDPQINEISQLLRFGFAGNRLAFYEALPHITRRRFSGSCT